MPWLRDLIVDTVWPYLQAVGDQLKLLREAGGTGAAPSAASGSSSAPGRVTDQINFSASSSSGDTFVAPGGGAGTTLLNALLLYRARGGEVIRKYQLTQPAGLADTWTIELKVGTYDRAATSSFSDPIVISVDSLDHHIELTPNQALAADQCLFAFISTTVAAEPGGRVDGTLEIERDATLS